MTVGEFLTSATKELTNAKISSARLDCLILLEDVLQVERAQILAHPEAEITAKTEVKLNNKIVQRMHHTPLAYLRGKANFYGREFIVSPDVLVPRPESESIIELLKAAPLPESPAILDVGTGSGCLGITAALEITDTTTILCDIDPAALDIAKQNAAKHKISVRFMRSDLVKGVSDAYDVLLANLPYVPENYPINAAAEHEPKLALFAGSDGLDLYRRLWQQIANMNLKPLFVVTESLTNQHVRLAALALQAGYTLTVSNGLAQCFKR